MSKGKAPNNKKSDVLQGALDLMILKPCKPWGHCMDSELPAVSNK